MEPAAPRAQHSLVVRPISPDERRRFDETLESSHWLGAGLVGEVMRYVAVEDGEWAALIGFGSAALCVRSREELLSWSDSQRHRRLRYLTNNQRFCILEEHRRPNLASQVLSLALARLSTDFDARWGHPVVMVETVTDPARHVGTCYKASNFTELGQTSGYGRVAGRFVHHGGQKTYWIRTLRRDALALLRLDFDHPVLARRTMSALDLNRLDLDSPSGLLVRLEAVPDPRKARGIRHRLAPILAIATLATLRGATSLCAIGEVAAELPDEALRRLSCRVSPRSDTRVAPEESTIRRALKAVDANAVDVVVNAWIADQVAAGRLAKEHAIVVGLADLLDREDAPTEDDDSDSEDEPALLPAVAVDGKTLRGARLGDGRAVHLMSAMTHGEGATIAQCDVDTKTNEITAFAPLLERLELRGVVVTADAMHAQREHARFLVEQMGAHYVLGLKNNQPSLLEAAERLCSNAPIAHETHDKGHGRTEHRYVRVVTIPRELAGQLGFPSAGQFVAVERERADLADRMSSTETSYYVTDLTPTQAGPRELACYIRGHWGIENRSHFVRDRVFDEDRSQVRVGGAPQVLATLRNLAISLLRLRGFTSIAAGLRWVAWDHERALTLMGL